MSDNPRITSINSSIEYIPETNLRVTSENISVEYLDTTKHILTSIGLMLEYTPAERIGRRFGPATQMMS